MINVGVSKKVDIDANKAIIKAVEDAEKRLDGRGRVLLRASGTEPVIRVMVEAEDSQLVHKVATDISAVVEHEVNQ